MLNNKVLLELAKITKMRRSMNTATMLIVEYIDECLEYGAKSEGTIDFITNISKRRMRDLLQKGGYHISSEITCDTIKMREYYTYLGYSTRIVNIGSVEDCAFLVSATFIDTENS